MIKKSTLIKLAHSGKIDHLTVEKIGTNKVIHCASLYVSRKGNAYFNDEEGQTLLSFWLNDVIIISRTNHKTDNENEYIFFFELKGHITYEIRIFMQDGYTPFITNKEDIEKFKAVYESIPQKLQNFKGKSVIVTQTIETEQFNRSSYVRCCENQELATSFKINKLDYSVEMIDRVPVLKIIDADNKDIICKMLKVSIIVDMPSLKSVVIGSENAQYYLQMI